MPFKIYKTRSRGHLFMKIPKLIHSDHFRIEKKACGAIDVSAGARAREELGLPAKGCSWAEALGDPNVLDCCAQSCANMPPYSCLCECGGSAGTWSLVGIITINPRKRVLTRGSRVKFLTFSQCPKTRHQSTPANVLFLHLQMRRFSTLVGGNCLMDSWSTKTHSFRGLWVVPDMSDANRSHQLSNFSLSSDHLWRLWRFLAVREPNQVGCVDAPRFQPVVNCAVDILWKKPMASSKEDSHKCS